MGCFDGRYTVFRRALAVALVFVLWTFAARSAFFLVFRTGGIWVGILSTVDVSVTELAVRTPDLLLFDSIFGQVWLFPPFSFSPLEGFLFGFRALEEGAPPESAWWLEKLGSGMSSN